MGVKTRISLRGWRIECQTQHAIEPMVLHGCGIVRPRSHQFDRARGGTHQLTGLWVDHWRRHGNRHSHRKPHQHAAGEELGLANGLQQRHGRDYQRILDTGKD